VTGHGVVEVAHGSAAKHPGQETVGPGSVLLSGVVMFEHIGWDAVAVDRLRRASHLMSIEVIR